MFHVIVCILLSFIYMYAVVDQLPRLGKRAYSSAVVFLCVVSVWMSYGILLWPCLSLPCNYLLGHFTLEVTPLSLH